MPPRRPLLSAVVSAACLLAAVAAGLLLTWAALPRTSRAAGDRLTRTLSPGSPVPASPPVVDAVTGHPLTGSKQGVLTVDSGSRPVPPSFLGLSTEYWSLPHYDAQRRLFERVIDQLRTDGPLLLRIGGDSADVSIWTPGQAPPPSWSYPVTPHWLTQTHQLVLDTGVKILLDLNLVDRAPALEAGWAKRFADAMPADSVVATEIGNEPDLYRIWNRAGRLATASRAVLANYFAWTRDFSPVDYSDEFSLYANALHQDLPNMPLAGPSLSNPEKLPWVSQLLRQRALGLVTVHRYPLSACQKHRVSPTYPTIARLMSERSSAGLANSVRGALRLAHRNGRPLRVTELNSVTCGGLKGVSGTFANALWAPDALFELMRVGVDGVNVHVRTNALNSPFVLRHGKLHAKPILYGLALFARMLSPGSRLISSHLRVQAGLHVKGWVVKAPGGQLRVLLINKGRRGAILHVHLPAGYDAGQVQRLRGPSLTASQGITLAGQTLGSDGLWHGKLSSQAVAAQGGSFELAVPGDSAALLTAD
jgi:hypothetical protein